MILTSTRTDTQGRKGDRAAFKEAGRRAGGEGQGARFHAGPYKETHVTVDAPDPVRNSRIEKLLIKKRCMLQFLMNERLAVENFIQSIEDSRTRQIFDAVFVKGKSQQLIADELGISQMTASRIISKLTESEEERL